MTKPLIIYHGGCEDGFTAAWVCNAFLGDKGLECELYYGMYQTDPPDVTDRDVFIVDFSYSRDILMNMKSKAKSLIVLDHHISAQKALDGLDFCIFDMQKSGARLAWEYFSDQTPIPLVMYTEDHDLWRHQLPFTKEVNAAVKSYEHTLENWDLLNVMLSGAKAIESLPLVVEGKAILRYKERWANNLAKTYRIAEIAEHKVPVVNSAMLQSEIGHILDEEYPFAAVWFRHSEGDFVYSLRSRKVDVSEIAKQFGGGGHKAAAGFKVDHLIHEENRPSPENQT